MKTIIGFLIFLLTFQTVTNSDKHVGKWTGEESGKIISLTLDKEGFATFEVEGQILGGKSSERKGTQVQMTYEIDSSQTPHFIDLIITEKSTGNEQARMLGIIEFININKMKFAIGNNPNIRPNDFSEKFLLLEMSSIQESD
ncbi:hypothetical protein LVD17_00330 [Fulvivirga ulvae]|uniref:hypothetical protein n=1 Tax=Fulvivirga ulvae TaxID=2904245 RepID=UPI001F3822A8|nr:hypothetical protein [Fulvivirga ulvae]UII32283.1 hypothetical protein LVD17_00330 [Fulvivirga ulvae]